MRVQRIDLPEDVATRVYDSMKQNFAKIASRLRGEGSSAAVRIRATAERQRTEILADAERDALRVRGQADAEAAQIYRARLPEQSRLLRLLPQPAGLRALTRQGRRRARHLARRRVLQILQGSGHCGQPGKPAKR